ncbi:MAG: DUF4440 domain-containing protein, partial [Acidobacteriota bacterium]|nr:DUF4440 domain-containing protein [Acidobacteriota bacterium]
PEAALLALSTEIRAPMLLGLIRPMILLPADIKEWTTAEERGWMIEHEMTHLSRRDNLIILFQALMGIIFFFHPLVRYALDQLSLERELACDDLIVRRGTISSRYAESLLKVVERSLPFQAAVPPLPFASRRTLQKRIDNIMKTNRSLEPGGRLSGIALPIAIVLAVMGLLGCVSAGGQISGEEQEVREFLREATEAEISGGPETFDRLAAPEFIRIGTEGEVWNKEQMLAVVRRGKSSTTEAVEIRDERIRIYGNTAIVTGLGIARGHDRTGHEFVVRNLCTIVLVKRDGSWRCVSVQQTRQV